MLGYVSGIGYSWNVGADGWTVFHRSRTTRTVYVSSSVGNDSWTGLLAEPTPSMAPTDGPVASISTALTKMSNPTGQPDWVLFRCGDTWTGQVSISGARLGRSAKEPMVFGSYSSIVSPSTVRPQFIQTDSAAPFVSFIQISGSNMAFVGLNIYGACFDPASASFQGATVIGDTTAGSNVITNIAVMPPNVVAGWGVWGTGVNNFTIAASGVGVNSLTLNTGQNASYSATQIPIQVMTRGSSNGLILNGQVNTFIIEDCALNFAGISLTQNTNVQPPPVQMFVRRCVITNPYAVNAGACAFIGPNLTITPSDQVQFYQCLMDHGGWNETVWPGGSSIFTHDLYLHNPSPPYNLSSNIISNASATGVQHRDGGTDTNNLFIADPTNLFGVSETSEWTVSNNVFANPGDLIAGFRLATAAAAAGTVLSVDGMSFSPLLNPSTGVGCGLTNMSNPGSLSGSVGSINTSAISINISGGSISAGQRGDGVQIGDKIQFWLPRAIGLQVNTIGVFVSAGAATQSPFLIYAGPSTVSISAASPAIVTEPGIISARPAGEPFQFSAGVLPTGLSLSTTYYSLDTGTTYRVALTAGGAPINTTGSTASGVTRTGSRLFFFNKPLQTGWPIILVPASVNIGSTIRVPEASGIFPGSFGGSTTVTSIASDLTSLIAADSSLASFAGAGQDTFLFDAPSNPSINPTRLGPSNILINGNYNSSAGNAISLTNNACNVDASGNYIYNWSMVDTSNDVIDRNTDPAFSASNNITQSLDVANNTSFPKASIEAYDATLQNNQFTATITHNGSGGGTLSVTSGSSPQVGDTIFDVNFAGLVPQYVYVVSGSGSTFFVALRHGSIAGDVASTVMISGSASHFIQQAALNSKASWNTAYTAPVANNFIRTAMGLPTV